MGNTILVHHLHAEIIVRSPKYGDFSALIDVGDVDVISMFNWNRAVGGKGGAYVASRQNGRTVYLHRLVMSAPEGMEVDHINGLPYDCRKGNLRVVTHQGNLRNRGKPSHNTSGFKGVAWQNQNGNWRAYGKLHGRQVHLGSFADVRDAGRASAAWRAANYPTSPEAAS